MALQLESANSEARRCVQCASALPEQYGAGRRRLYCDECRELARIMVHLRQAQAIAERLGYDDPLAVAIRGAIRVAQR